MTGKLQKTTGISVSKIALILLTGALALSLVGDVSAKKRRKLPLKAYLSGAKISGGFTDETPHYDAALALLDSCTEFYGPVPEAYFWQVLIHSKMAEDISRTDTVNLLTRFNALVSARDSLAMSCDADNEEFKVKKKLRKKCDAFLITADSARDEWYTTYFNDAQESRRSVTEEMIPELAELQDQDKADLQEEIDELTATAVANYDMAMIFHPIDLAIQINLSDIYVQQSNFEQALVHQQKAADIAKESDPDNYAAMLNQVAYSQYELKDYLKAADVFKEIATLVDDEQKVAQYKNVNACYSSLEESDSVFVYGNKILELAPTDAPTLSMLGGMWFNKIQKLNMKRSEAREAEDKALDKQITAELKDTGDSASVYLKRAFEADPQDANSIEFYAITNTLASKIEEASWAWEKLTQLAPTEKRYWLYLGDNYIKLQKFKEAITPFEKSLEIDDTNIDVWQQLAELYRNHGMTKKAKAAQTKIDKLSKS